MHARLASSDAPVASSKHPTPQFDMFKRYWCVKFGLAFCLCVLCGAGAAQGGAPGLPAASQAEPCARVPSGTPAGHPTPTAAVRVRQLTWDVREELGIDVLGMWLVQPLFVVA